MPKHRRKGARLLNDLSLWCRVPWLFVAGMLLEAVWQSPSLAVTRGALPTHESRAIRQQGFTVLHSFAGGSHDGMYPSGVIVDKAGRVWGTTLGGGLSNDGTIFELSRPNRRFRIAHSFQGTGDGAGPAASPVLDGAGNLFATALGGGAQNDGTVIELSPFRGGYQQTGLFAFDGADGASPGAALLVSSGTFFTTTRFGGKYGRGAIVALSSGPSGFSEVDLHDFKGRDDGEYPEGGLVQDASGTLYGMTRSGGAGHAGVVFKFNPSAGGGTERVIWAFQSQSTSDGAIPYGTLLLDAEGNLYGTTSAGGTGSFSGIIFELSPKGHRYEETVLWNFQGPFGTGAYPLSGLTAVGGALYGTASAGGMADCYCGVIFSLTLSPPTYTVLHDFIGADGRNPNSALFAFNGSLYGTTPTGGASQAGVVFELQP
jgi:uncharacterized repeat protein (TIGR03803 family)